MHCTPPQHGPHPDPWPCTVRFLSDATRALSGRLPETCTLTQAPPLPTNTSLPGTHTHLNGCLARGWHRTCADKVTDFGATACVPRCDTQAHLQALHDSALATAIAAADQSHMGPAYYRGQAQAYISHFHVGSKAGSTSVPAYTTQARGTAPALLFTIAQPSLCHKQGSV